MRATSIFSLSALLACLIAFATPASAATFDFNFNLATDNIAGQFVLPDGDGTFAALDGAITVAPSTSGLTLPFDLIRAETFEITNSFTVSGGIITAADFSVVVFAGASPTLGVHGDNGSFEGSFDTTQGGQGAIGYGRLRKS